MFNSENQRKAELGTILLWRLQKGGVNNNDPKLRMVVNSAGMEVDSSDNKMWIPTIFHLLCRKDFICALSPKRFAFWHGFVIG